MFVNVERSDPKRGVSSEDIKKRQALSLASLYHSLFEQIIVHMLKFVELFHRALLGT